MALSASIAPNPTRWLIAFIAACIVAGLASKLRSLDTSGFLAASLLGTVLVGSAGLWSGVLLVSFFVTSSILSTAIHTPTTVSTDRGNRRDAVQVVANGGVVLIMAIIFARTASPVWIFAITGAIAASSADTWSTEIGRLSPTPPHLITTGRKVAAGTSGAISGTGLAGAVAGATFIALMTLLGNILDFFPTHVGWVATIITLIIAGLGGSLLDSFLGATVQERRYCPVCNKETEKRIHTCGTPTQLSGGVRGVTNDVVNIACTIAGATIAAFVAVIRT